MNQALPVPLDVKLMNRTARLLLLGFVLLALGTGGRWLAWHPFFAIRGLTVQGDIEHTSAPTLRAHVAPQIQGTFLTVDLNAVREAFETLPWVRKAVVQREFPNRLRVILQEHEAVAYWGDEGDSTLVNSQGEVFEANLGEIEQDELPHLDGPSGQSALVWQTYRELKPLFAAVGLNLDSLAFSERGNWRAGLAGGASIELGGGEAGDIALRVQRFLDTVGQVAARHGRKLDALEGADLRYGKGYALRLRGVSTVAVQEQGRKP